MGVGEKVLWVGAAAAALGVLTALFANEPAGFVSAVLVATVAAAMVVRFRS